MIFRYPGCKARLRKAIMSLAPARFTEYREPFVGGGAVFFGIRKDVRRWINDMDPALMAVYLALRDRREPFIEACRAIKPLEEDESPERLQAVFHLFVEDRDMDPALRYFFLSRTAWGGVPYRLHRTPFCAAAELWNIVESDRLDRAGEFLQRVTITVGDYIPLLKAPGEGVWVYADPPYYS